MTWAQDDFHSRSYATLITARSVQIGLSVQPNPITSPQTSTSCTVCHAPLADCPRAATAMVEDGVSCESCHGPAAGWLRGHTRPDWTYADRIHAGMKDMRDAFVRANTCVACHQVIEPALIKAGHPTLIFEMDGQAASEPRHWEEKSNWFGPKAWAVGQAVALSKISTQLKDAPDSGVEPQQKALVWLLEKVPGVDATNVSADTAAWGNELAQTFSNHDWKSARTGDTLAALAGTSASFTDGGVSLVERKMRAERLVLGLDRLFKAAYTKKNAAGTAELAALFDPLQAPDPTQFDAQDFSAKLQKFADAIGAKK